MINQLYFSPTGGRYLGEGLGEVTATAVGLPVEKSGNDGVANDPADYPGGTQVTIMATPDEGYLFAGWTTNSTINDCAAAGASPSCVLTMTHASDVVGNFTVAVHTLTVTNASSTDGGVTDGVGDINCGGPGSPTPNMCSGQEAAQHACPPTGGGIDCNGAQSQSAVTLRAKAFTTGVDFGGFDGCDLVDTTPTDPTVGYCVLSMTADRTVTVHWTGP